MRYLPEWLPGAAFKKTARQWSSELTDLTEKPYAFVKYQLAQGMNNMSFLSRLLETGDSHPEEEFTNKWSAMSLYTAGADTVRCNAVVLQHLHSLFALRKAAANFFLDCIVCCMLLFGYDGISRSSAEGTGRD